MPQTKEARSDSVDDIIRISQGDSLENNPPLDGTTQEKITDDFDNNNYQTKKTVAETMMVLALLSANAVQFQLLIEGFVDDFSGTLIILLSLAVALDIAAAVMLCVTIQLNINHEERRRAADTLCDVVTFIALLSTILNVFILAFSGTSET
ncbi:ninjurin-2-like [Ptychodera flava]|uniref:ninjurin-2-like n=1 Tax=Ptychodera flava TaxID=63121 RepID=UPI00396AA16B